MKLLRHGPKGAEKPGLLDAAGRVRDLSGVVPDIAGSTLSPAGLAALAKVDPATLPEVPEGTRLGPCVGSVGKFICIGLNYADHARESGAALPKEPVVFMKATSALSGPNDPIELPRGHAKADWEVELGVVIGTEAKYVTVDDALSHVAGYCVVNDVSERAFQLERGGQWVKGKSADTFGPTGPWLVTADEVPDPQDLALWLEVDGERRQNGTTRDMLFSVAQVIAHLSEFMSLQPGDIISTGTPAGVGLGMTPPTFLKAGQSIRLAVEGLGEQSTVTVDAP
jgi:2-keto-4-pentenoate hydratase/2-oxohepta-3-ene-1,7-dioic acid hydratase in catechol pathway